MACPMNCSFQEAASPLVNNDKTNAIHLLSLLYISSLIEVKMQQSCHNLVRSFLFPEKSKGMLSLISLGEAADAEEEEAMLFSLEGPRLSWAKRSRRELGLLGLGLKWIESNKGSLSPILLIQFIHWGSPQHLFVCLGFRCTQD